MRTYSREDFFAAKAEWADFDEVWRPYRQLAAERGMLYPPSGTRWDSWEDEEPSQRAILYRAICDTPKALTRIIGASRSWSEVVRKVIADVDRRREDADFAERQDDWDRQDQLTPPEALHLLAGILDRIRDSAA